MKATVYVPTHRQIREECQRIRESWTDREHRLRAVYARGLRWTLPVAGDPRFQFDSLRCKLD
jgi:hypothetical protein